ncbi:HAMP domain-containing protein [Caminibacter mediatlanticus]|uniref:histidine kinase n=1 Tax=Caminibacter mediatlanticus TB-2 TaxID=391592 RepID=A0AAI9AHP9_9BACT|nr:HAMP domain-containing protein [Caminibacter mediatlanticus]EDM23832.1 hypothetical protein CMTB2_01154 [Caminibacter mediatlanticus TB-2]
MIKKINILFGLLFLFITILFYWSYTNINTKNQEIIINKYIIAIKELMPFIVTNNNAKLKQKINELNLQKISNIDGKKIFSKDITFGKIDILQNKNKYYLKIKYLNSEYIFFDSSQIILLKENNFIMLSYLLILFLLSIAYFIIKSIFKPLNLLNKKIDKLSKGDLNINKIELKADKEIQNLIDSFNHMASQINNFIIERENFIKYIGHELKTPLAKLKFAIENKDLEKIKKHTNNLDILINELILINLITKENMKLQNFNASTLILNALSNIDVEEENIEIELNDFNINADKQYLTIAIKNIIENAIKYTTKYPIKIVAKNNFIEVVNYGDKKLEFKEIKKLFVKNSKGLGIGLNLVEKIVKLHNFSFEYEFENNHHIFRIILKDKNAS